MRVVIVGGGTVGLCTAVFLARQGVSVHVLERRAKVNDHPRAFGISDRSAEILREAGIEVDTAQITAGLMRGSSLASLTAVTSQFERPEIGPDRLGHCPQDRIDRAALAMLPDLGAVGAENVIRAGGEGFGPSPRSWLGWAVFGVSSA